jgi:hypothetical protein
MCRLQVCLCQLTAPGTYLCTTTSEGLPSSSDATKPWKNSPLAKQMPHADMVL